MTKKIQMMSHDKEWQIVDGQEVLVPVEQIDIDPITDSSAVQIEGHRTLEETLATKHQMTPEIDETKIMSKVGGVYHQNVVDGAYEEAILYGNSKVNLMEDDTTTAQSIPLTFTSFNNGLQKELALGTNTVAPMLKGATLINRALTNSVTLASGEKFYIHNLKGNTIHTVSFKFTTKNTNAGVVIESCTGETYLENSMHKTGLGDNVIFTVTTHANADSIAIVNNAAYGGETIKLDDIMVIEGDQTLMNLTFFKGMRSVELVKPLTNLFTNDLQYYSSQTTATNSNGNVTVTSTASSSWTMSQYYLSSLKPNTKYLVMWDSLTTTQTSTGQQEILVCVVDITNNVKLGGINEDSKCPTKRSIIFDTGSRDLSQIVFRVHATMSNTETGTTTVKGLRVFEWDDTTSRALDLQGIGYFSGTKNVSIPNFKTNSKNLYPYGDVNFTPVNASIWHDGKGKAGMTGDIASKSQTRFLLRKGKYTVSASTLVNCGMQVVGDKEEILTNGIQSGSNATFTLEQDTYCTLRFKNVEANVVCTATNIQIERGDTATSYVSYDTRQYKSDNREVVVLRSLPNGVCDTFNLQTGEYVQRIGEVVLNGTKALALDAILTNTIRFRQMGNVAGLTNQSCLCDKMVSEANYISDYEHIYVNKTDVWCFINRASVSSEDVDGIRQYLKSNPLTVQYQLSEPIIKQIPIVNSIYNASSRVDFKEGKNASFRCFGNPTYLEVGSLSPINPIVEPIINVPLNARLKANTSYTVRLDRTGSSLNVDLGGTTVSTSNSTDNEFIIKTPTGMLSHNQIRFSGNGSIGRVMVFEGDIRGIELPYFMGINNVKMPIVRNCGKNLFNMNDVCEADGWKSDMQIGSNKIYNVCKRETGGGFGAKVRVKLKPNTQYYIGWEGQNSVYVYIYWNSDIWGTQGSIVVNRNTTFTTPGYVKYATIGLNYLSNGCAINTFISTVNPILVEVGNDTSYEPYRGNDICLAQGEIGLSQDMFEQGGYGTGSGATKYEDMKYDVVDRTRIKTYLKVKPNTTYKLAYDGKTRINHREYMIDGVTNGTYSAFDEKEKIFTTKDTTEYITILLECRYSNFKVDNLQLLELDSTVQLRSLPNGVKDELNLLTGEYIQRVGEVVIDGSQSIYSERPNHKRMYIVKDDMKKLQNYSTSMVCDKINVSMDYSQLSGTENTWVSGYSDMVNLYPNKNWIYFNIENIEDVSSMTTYLQSNPITVQYELAEPIVSYPRIVSNTQEREVGVKLPNGICDTYNPSTGITVKRVGFVEFNGTEDWGDSFVATTDVYGVWTEQPLVNAKPAPTNERIPGVCDKLNFKNSTLGSTNEEFYFISPTGRFNMNLSRSKLSEPTEQALKTYLSQNPIKLWYELKNPIVTTDIVLPNGVHDEYNPLTGLYTKRVMCVEFDGSDDEVWSLAGTNPFAYIMLNPIAKTQSMITNNLSVNNNITATSTDLGSVIVNPNNEQCLLRVRTQDILNGQTITDFKTYLSQNPLKVWYELQTPITYQLTPYFGLPMPYAYQDGHLIMDSAYDGVSLPPEFKYRLIANRTGQVNQNNIKLQQHTTRLSNLEAMLVDATLQSMYEREMMAFNLEMVNINLINLEE